MCWGFYAYIYPVMIFATGYTVAFGAFFARLGVIVLGLSVYRLLKGGVAVSTSNPEKSYLIHLIASLAHNNPLANPPQKLNWDSLHHISSRHRLSNMVCYGVEKLAPGQQPDPAVLEKFQRDRKLALAREAAQHFCFDELIKAFEEHRIHCLPLKSCLIKHLYPQPDMRSMADIDILFQDEQTEEVKSLMLGLGFTLKNFGGNHDVYIKKPFLNIEMHRRLVAENSPYSEYLAKIWQRARIEAGYKYVYRLSPEDFYIYLLIHLTKHYINAGTGIRSILDVFLYEKHYGFQMDKKYVGRELENIKLQKFAENIRVLAKAWFDKGQGSTLHAEMAQYIFASGVYGIERHGTIASLNKNQGHQIASVGMTKLRYQLKLFFPGLKHMSILYPYLHRLPFLLPFTWALRGLKSLLLKKERTFRLIGNVQSVTKNELDKIYDLHQRAGL